MRVVTRLSNPFSASLVCLLWLTTATTASAGTVVVTPSSLNGWATNITGGTSGIAAFVLGPSTPPLGTGSVNLAIGDGTADGDEAARIASSSYAGTRLADLTALSFSTYATVWNGQQVPYLQLKVDRDGVGGYDDDLFFEAAFQNPVDGNPALPNQGAAVLNAWQTWNALTGGWWSGSGDGSTNPGTGVNSLAAYLSVNPDATIVNPSAVGGIRLNVGFGSANDQFNGNVDNFTIATDAESTTYDFELSAAAPVPEPSSFVVYSLSALGFSLMLRRRQVG